MLPSRRAVLQSSSAVLLASVLPRVSVGQAMAPGLAKSVGSYLTALRREDGGFGWGDQNESHVTTTWAAVQCHALLGLPLSDKGRIAAYVREAHPQKNRRPERELHLFEQQQIETLLALGEDASSFAAKVATWKRPEPYLRQYERDQNPVIQQEVTAVLCRKRLGMPMEEVREPFVKFFADRRRANGSYNHTPAIEGSDGHVLNTLWVLLTLEALGEEIPAKEPLVNWLQKCQRPNGGFTYQPEPSIAGVDDVAYSWGAVRCLEILGARPRDAEGAIRYLHSLRLGDGSFSDRVGWRGNPVATYYAIDGLRGLKALDQEPSVPPGPTVVEPALPEGLKVYSALIEAHGQGSPSEAVELAKALRIDLWGAKGARPAWIARAQQIADARKVPVRFFVADEEYGTWVMMPGLGTYSHTSDLIAPAGSDIGPPVKRVKDAPTWEEFRKERVVPLERGRGRLVWQFGENEELTRVYLDDSLERGGYAAISTFHFGNPDFTLSSPFLYRWHGQIPWIALHDAHGTEPWWFSDQTTGFRTLFLATDPTYEGLLNALKQNWTAPVRRDVPTGHRLRLHAGLDSVRAFVLKHQDQWQWWDEKVGPGRRPVAVLTVLRAEDEFEVGRPEEGAALRVRCMWENTTQGLPKRQLWELAGVTMDGKALEMKKVDRRNGRGAMVDQYHICALPGDYERRKIVAKVREVGGNGEVEVERRNDA